MSNDSPSPRFLLIVVVLLNVRHCSVDWFVVPMFNVVAVVNDMSSRLKRTTTPPLFEIVIVSDDAVATLPCSR
jgi:hypothetical protein